MLDQWPILTLIAFSPLIGIAALLFIPRDRGDWIKRVGFAATLIPLVLATWLYIDFRNDAAGYQYEERATWLRIDLNSEMAAMQQVDRIYYQFDYNMAVDGISMPLVFLTALISSMAALAAFGLKKRWKAFYILFLLLEIGMFGVFMAKDLFLFFLFFELTLVPAFFMIGIWGLQEREKAANKFLLYNGIGSAIMIIAFLIIINTAGFSTPGFDGANGSGEAALTYSGNLDVIKENLTSGTSMVNYDTGGMGVNPFYLSEGFKATLFLLLFVAFGIKLPVFPFHSWMVKVHGQAPPALVMIHAGILLKMGAYGLIRFGFHLFPEQAARYAGLLAVLGVISILYGAALAFVQRELRLVLAYSSISHMGIVLLGLAALNEIGLQGAVFQLVSHGLIAALFFLIVGSLYDRTGTTQLEQLGGLAKSMPFMSAMLLIAGLASLGLPGMSGFVSELMAFIGMYGARPAIAIVGTLGLILAAAYVLRSVLRITYGPIREKFADLRDARLVEAVPMIVLFAFILLIGVYPAILYKMLQPAIQQLVFQLGG